MTDKIMIARRVMTPDGVILHSKYRHDCVGHTDEKGTYYQLDGGTDGYGSCCNLDKCTDISVYVGDDHEVIREVFMWRSCLDKDGNRLSQPKFLFVSEMEDGHVESLVEWTNDGYPEWMNNIFKEEVSYRKNNDV